MDPIVVYPDPPAPEVVRTLDVAGHAWKAVSDSAVTRTESVHTTWSAAVVSLVDNAPDGLGVCRALRSEESGEVPVLVLVPASMLDSLGDHADLFDDFCLAPFHPSELAARLAHLLRHVQDARGSELVEYGPLVLNLETYQAAIAGRPVDLTYMEYELLKYLAQHPGRVFTRETLLSQVWGYEYYGGARTVDVHVRRLRAKLGEEHAGLISTVRSVGYRFGQSRWGV